MNDSERFFMSVFVVSVNFLSWWLSSKIMRLEKRIENLERK